MTRDSMLDAVVVGGGQAGLGIAYFLKRAGLRFVVYERGRVGESWRSQRWDSFALNTPNWMNGLPGAPYAGSAPDEFWHRDDLVDSFERYVGRFELPVETGVSVARVAPQDGGGFEVTSTRGGQRQQLLARNVVIASGIMQAPLIPAVGAQLPDSITQVHTGDYRNPGALPDGAVLVVGSGQSGCQIVEDLLAAGRKVYLCTSRVGRAPRRHRGRDILAWWQDMGLLDVTLGELEDPAMAKATQPQISGVGRYGHTVSLESLAHKGVTLLGHVDRVQGQVLHLDGKLGEYVRFADEKSAAFHRAIDDYIAREGIDAPPMEDDAADEPDDALAEARGETELDLAAAGISTVVWCTGFTADFSWVDAPLSADTGHPVHERGVSPLPGLYYLGFPWLHKRKSGIIHGVEEDAAYIAQRIHGRAASD